MYNCTEKKTGMKCAVKVMDLEELSDDEFAKIALESTICDVSLSCSACNSRSPWFALFLHRSLARLMLALSNGTTPIYSMTSPDYIISPPPVSYIHAHHNHHSSPPPSPSLPLAVLLLFFGCTLADDWWPADLQDDRLLQRKDETLPCL